MENLFTIYDLPLETPALLKSIDWLKSDEFKESVQASASEQRKERKQLLDKAKLQELMEPALAGQLARIQVSLEKISEPDPTITARQIEHLYSQLPAARARDSQLIAGALKAHQLKTVAGNHLLSFEAWDEIGRVTDEMRAAGIIETDSDVAPVDNAVATSSPARPGPTFAPTPPATLPALTTNPASELALEARSKLSLRQVALLQVYNRKTIAPAGSSELARRYGYTSGAKLYDHYRTVSQRAGRIGDEITGQKLRPMVADISAVVSHLTDTARQQAESELQTLLARKEEK